MDICSPGVWRARNTAIFQFLEQHSATTEQIARGFFTGATMATRKKKASRWLVKQRWRHRVRLAGIVQRRDTGRPELVYGRLCKQDQLEHEVRIADLALRYQDWPFVRGVKVGKTEADALMVRDGRRCYIEVDNSGKMTTKQMHAKWTRYEGVEGFILVVAVTEARMQKLRKDAELVKDIALFTTFDRLESNTPEPWIDWYGHTVRV